MVQVSGTTDSPVLPIPNGIPSTEVQRSNPHVHGNQWAPIIGANIGRRVGTAHQNVECFFQQLYKSVQQPASIENIRDARHRQQ